MNVDLDQGRDLNGNRFGYVWQGEYGEGGYWCVLFPTLRDTIDSVSEDDVDGPGGLNRRDVQRHLLGYLAGLPLWDGVELSLRDYGTSRVIREATREELVQSIDAGLDDGGCGVILVDGVRSYVMES